MKELSSAVGLEHKPHDALAVASVGDQSFEPEFRVVTHQGLRIGLRLEHLFWSIIEAAASAKDMRLGAYIAEILEHKEANNNSSILRVHAAQWVSQRLKDTSARTLTPKFVVKVVQSAVFPCFLMDNENRIASQNDSFLALLRTQLGSPEPDAEATVHIRFGSDVASIRQRLSDTQASYIEDTVQVDVAGAKRELRARITTVDSTLGKTLGLLVMISP